jgi:paraquat-inducible protein B
MKKPNTKLIGAFIVGSVVLLLAALVFLNATDFLAKKSTYVSFFRASVRGLKVGAPVTFRGMEIGRVKEIYSIITGDSLQVRNAVIYEVEANKMRDPAGIYKNSEGEDFDLQLDYLIRMGVRAKLETSSLLTGQQHIEIDKYPETEPDLMEFDIGHPEIPVVPTEFDQIRTAIRQTVRDIGDVPISELIAELRALVAELNSVAQSQEIRETVANLRSTTAHLDELAQSLNTRSGTVVDEVEATAQSIRTTMDQATEVLAAIEKSSAEGSELQFQTLKTLDEVADAARAIRLLAEYLERHPEALVTGKGEK